MVLESIFAFEYPFFYSLLLRLMAVLYSSVGHGGASGYLAAMALVGSGTRRDAAGGIAMNIVVTSWLLSRFQPYKLMPIKLFWPLVIASTPLAFVGGLISIGAEAYRILLGVVLVLAAVRMLMISKATELLVQPTLLIIVLWVGRSGFVSGLTGIGGGVFLSPILLFLVGVAFAKVPLWRRVLSYLIPFAGLAGYMASDQSWPMGRGWLVMAALAGCLGRR